MTFFRLNSVTAVHRVNDEIDCTVLPMEGNFLSMRYDHFTDNILISTRPSKNYTTPRHIVGQLSKSVCGHSKSGVIDVIHTFHGNPTISLNLKRPNIFVFKVFIRLFIQHLHKFLDKTNEIFFFFSIRKKLNPFSK